MHCYCIVRCGTYAVARTKVFLSTSNQLWLEKFSIGDVAPWTTLTVELMQAQRGGKSALFGVVDLPVQTMRRGEDIDGWFPIWSTALAARENGPVGSAADPSSAYSRELIGELKLVIHLRDEVVMPKKRYEAVSQTLNSNKFIPLVSALTKIVDEQSVLGHLVDVFASSGTIVPRMADLTQAEMDTMNDSFEVELLFRGNTLLSRSLDKYQRTYCTEWLFDSIGLFILNICEQRIIIETPLAHDDSGAPGSYGNASASGAASSFVGAGDGDIWYLDQAETISHLKEWTRTLWQSIYGARNKCPLDLQRILYNIRCKVDAKFSHHQTAVDPGKQAVSAFAFLRLICPAIATPHLYGILPSAPEPRTSKILTTLAKIILSLGNRRSGFEKDTWLAPMTDFLRVSRMDGVGALCVLLTLQTVCCRPKRICMTITSTPSRLNRRRSDRPVTYLLVMTTTQPSRWAFSERSRTSVRSIASPSHPSILRWTSLWLWRRSLPTWLGTSQRNWSTRTAHTSLRGSTGSSCWTCKLWASKESCSDSSLVMPAQ